MKTSGLYFDDSEHSLDEVIEAAVAQKKFGEKITLYAKCLQPLLEALKWEGNAFTLCESFPFNPSKIELIDLLNIMANLGYHSFSEEMPIAFIDARLFPSIALFVKDSQLARPYILLEKKGRKLIAFDPRRGRNVEFDANSSEEIKFYHFKLSQIKNRITTPLNVIGNESMTHWIYRILGRFRGGFLKVFLATFFLQVLGLVPPLFVMNIYDKVVGVSSTEPAKYLIAGAFLAIVIGGLFGFVRSRIQGWIATRLDYIFSTTIYERLISLPAKSLDEISINALINRFSEFEQIRNVVSGPLGISVIELPFLFFNLTIVYLFAGKVVIVPVMTCLVYAILFSASFFKYRLIMNEISESGVELKETTTELLNNLRAIKMQGMVDVWDRRIREVSGKLSLANFRFSFLRAITENLAYGISIFAGLATVTYGIFLVWEGTLTAGALIATMMFVWKVINPMQVVFLSAGQLSQTWKTFKQIHKFMQIQKETPASVSLAVLNEIKGKISVQGVTHRFPNMGHPLFAGLSVEIEPGEVVAVTGGAGMGKTTFLKMIPGIVTPQMGSIFIDGHNILQIEPKALRRVVTYTSRYSKFFDGSIAENLRLVAPLATNREIEFALDMAGALEEVLRFPKGIYHIIRKENVSFISTFLEYQIHLARTFLRDTPINLFTELPSGFLNSPFAKFFYDYLVEKKGKKTILFTTFREEQMLLADKLMVFAGQGHVISGKPREILDAIRAVPSV